MKNLIPEWIVPSYIAMVWPEHLPAVSGSKLKPYFMALINKILQNGIPVKLFFRESNDIPAVERSFKDKPLKCQPLENISDIWIRDFGPMFIYEDNTVQALKTIYRPSYAYSLREMEWCRNNDTASWHITNKFKDESESRIPLILDGGNIIHNGQGKAIVTSRIIADNPYLFEDEIREILREYLGISELYIVPCEPDDDTGHIDGMVRFLNSNVVLVGDYQEGNPEGKKVTDKIAAYLEDHGFRVFRVPNAEPKPGKYNIQCRCRGIRQFENAAGNYMNFLRAGDIIFLPHYQKEKENIRALEALFDAIYATGREIHIEKIMEDATPLAEYGGVINCITVPLYTNTTAILRGKDLQ